MGSIITYFLRPREQLIEPIVVILPPPSLEDDGGVVLNPHFEYEPFMFIDWDDEEDEGFYDPYPYYENHYSSDIYF